MQAFHANIANFMPFEKTLEFVAESPVLLLKCISNSSQMSFQKFSSTAIQRVHGCNANVVNFSCNMRGH